VVTHEIPDLAKRQAMRLCLFDEADPVDGSRAIVLAKTAHGPARSRQQALSFVVPQRVASNAARGGQFADSKPA
jgi:hypothetical protein